MQSLQISGKTLGSLALADACERCFWLEIRCKPLPYQFFPGIFSSIDSYTKKVLHGHHDKHQKFPSWLSPLGDLVGYINPPSYQKFKITDAETNILLTGAADGILKRSDGSIIIVDYKTARFTDGQDGMIPVYDLQLNAYRIIAESLGMGTVSGLYLIYFEPATEEHDACHTMTVLENGFRMVFCPKVHEVKIDSGKVTTLLRRARAIGNLEKPPPANSKCKNCERLTAVMGAVTR